MLLELPLAFDTHEFPKVDTYELVKNLCVNEKSINGLAFGAIVGTVTVGTVTEISFISSGALTLILRFGVVGAPIVGKLIFKAVFWISLGLTAASIGTAEIGSITFLFKLVLPNFPPE